MLVKVYCTTVLVLCYISVKWTSATGLGPCPKLDSIGSVNISRMVGQWYEIERSFYLMELISSCVTLDLAENRKGCLNVLVNTKSTWTGTFSISEGVAIPTRADPSIYLYEVSSNLPTLMNTFLPGAGHYQVLKTDYVSYAIVYSCTNYQLFYLDMVWIWGRKREIDAGLRSDLYSILNTFDIDTDRLIITKHDNCTYQVYNNSKT